VQCSVYLCFASVSYHTSDKIRNFNLRISSDTADMLVSGVPDSSVRQRKATYRHRDITNDWNTTATVRVRHLCFGMPYNFRRLFLLRRGYIKTGSFRKGNVFRWKCGCFLLWFIFRRGQLMTYIAPYDTRGDEG
jgi:hypothetical protein